jgi:hypothetical protein
MTIYLIVANDPDSAFKEFHPEAYEDFRSRGPWKAQFLWRTIDGPEGWFFLPKNFSIVEIAHECFHAAHRTMDLMGDKFSSDNHEAVAYLQGDLMKWIIENYIKNGIPIPRT